MFLLGTWLQQQVINTFATCTLLKVQKPHWVTEPRVRKEKWGYFSWVYHDFKPPGGMMINKGVGDLWGGHQGLHIHTTGLFWESWIHFWHMHSIPELCTLLLSPHFVPFQPSFSQLLPGAPWSPFHNQAIATVPQPRPKPVIWTILLSFLWLW